jgi:hypothetical protein
MEGCQVQNPACYTCRFFRAGSSNAFGSCNHPNHQHTGVPITIRAQEVNCYRGFGASDWMPALIGEFAECEDVILSERPAPIRAPWLGLTPFDQSDHPLFGLRD